MALYFQELQKLELNDPAIPNNMVSNSTCVAALDAETTSIDVIAGTYEARGTRSETDRNLSDRAELAAAGQLKLWPIQRENAARLTNALMRAEAACKVLRNLVEHGLSDPEAMMACANILSSSAACVGKGPAKYGVANAQHKKESQWVHRGNAKDEMVTVDDPSLYTMTYVPVTAKIGYAYGGTVTSQRAAARTVKRRKSKAELREETRQLELKAKKTQKPVETAAEPV